MCLLGGANAGKSFLLKGLRDIFRCYERPDGGTYQLEDLIGSEVVFLNDFEYDTGAKDWMPWSYFKNFLEGGSVKVARPKNRGGNVKWSGSAPVFMTAPREVTLVRRGAEVMEETRQMRKRICYMEMHYCIPDEQRQEVLQPCGHCSARLYLEGLPDLGASPAQPPAIAPSSGDRSSASSSSGPVGSPAQPPPSSGDHSSSSASSSNGPVAKRSRTAKECIAELKDLKQLLDAGAVTAEEFAHLKARLLQGQ